MPFFAILIQRIRLSTAPLGRFAALPYVVFERKNPIPLAYEKIIGALGKFFSIKGVVFRVSLEGCTGGWETPGCN